MIDATVVAVVVWAPSLVQPRACPVLEDAQHVGAAHVGTKKDPMPAPAYDLSLQVLRQALAPVNLYMETQQEEQLHVLGSCGLKWC